MEHRALASCLAPRTHLLFHDLPPRQDRHSDLADPGVGVRLGRSVLLQAGGGHCVRDEVPTWGDAEHLDLLHVRVGGQESVDQPQ